ncbi:MAG: hypothetical protein M3R00_05035 [Pseudomonadota bacterium]|nr:hypothetical protein [Pseudomonadota bacterium]
MQNEDTERQNSSNVAITARLAQLRGDVKQLIDTFKGNTYYHYSGNSKAIEYLTQHIEDPLFASLSPSDFLRALEQAYERANKSYWWAGKNFVAAQLTKLMETYSYKDFLSIACETLVQKNAEIVEFKKDLAAARRENLLSMIKACEQQHLSNLHSIFTGYGFTAGQFVPKQISKSAFSGRASEPNSPRESQSIAALSQSQMIGVTPANKNPTSDDLPERLIQYKLMASSRCEAILTLGGLLKNQEGRSLDAEAQHTRDLIVTLIYLLGTEEQKPISVLKAECVKEDTAALKVIDTALKGIEDDANNLKALQNEQKEKKLRYLFSIFGKSAYQVKNDKLCQDFKAAHQSYAAFAPKTTVK